MELFTPDFGLIFWMFVSFGVLFLVLWRYAWPIILKGLDQRADLIDKGVEYAQNAKLQLDNAKEEADKISRAGTPPAGRHAPRGRQNEKPDNRGSSLRSPEKKPKR